MEEHLESLLDRWNIRPRAVEPLAGGAVNRHWRVEPHEGPPVVLRRYNPRHDPAGTEFEHVVLRYLAVLGWPVAPPLRSADGAHVVEEGGRWALFPFLEGRPPEGGHTLTLQRKGNLLALVQRDLSGINLAGQRPGWGRVDDLDRAVQPEFVDFAALVDWLAADDPQRAEALAGFRERNLHALGRLGYDELPDEVGWFEGLGANVLFRGDDVTGLLDFDFTHRDARVADAARSLAVDCGARLERVRAWMRGYATFATPDLTRQEAELLPVLMISNALWNTAVPMALHARGGPEWMGASVRASLDDELPGLEFAQGWLRAACVHAAGLDV